ncbi:MAG: hypothetical protein CM15mP39_04010 [Synechococcus sp.]|nr:MAG: hypothetical protein CM15mP39_04010 [Synechococcus sp.]
MGSKFKVFAVYAEAFGVKKVTAVRDVEIFNILKKLLTVVQLRATLASWFRS